MFLFFVLIFSIFHLYKCKCGNLYIEILGIYSSKLGFIIRIIEWLKLYQLLQFKKIPLHLFVNKTIQSTLQLLRFHFSFFFDAGLLVCTKPGCSY